MKRIVRLTEIDLRRIVKRVLKEQTEGDTEFVQTIVDKYQISDELKNEIVNTIKSSETKKIEFRQIKMGSGLCLGDRLIIHPNTLNYPLGKFLFILFHELAHQYQFKKYGQEKMLELYGDEMDIKDAAKYMKYVESVADEFAFRKMKNLERRKVVKIQPMDIMKGYESISVNMLENLIRSFRDELKKNNVTGSQNITEYLYNMVKIEQNQFENQPRSFTQQQTKKEEPKTYGKTINVDDVEYVVPDGVETIIGSVDTYNIEDLNDVKYIDGNLSIHNNLKTLENVETINGKLWITNKNFESFGNLKSVSGNVILKKNIDLLKNYTEDNIRNMIDIGGEIIIK